MAMTAREIRKLKNNLNRKTVRGASDSFLFSNNVWSLVELEPVRQVDFA
jgi:hypothetical protein